MTLSIEVLPAPFGPMMARISPPAMSNETPVNALTPPNDNETRSTERRDLEKLPTLRGGLFSPPPCGEGSGVGVAPYGRAVALSLDPPPRPSPARGEGEDRAFRPPTGWLMPPS